MKDLHTSQCIADKANSSPKKALAQEFYKLYQLEHFVDQFLCFLKAKKNSETLEFILQLERLQKECELCIEERIQRIQDLMNKFVKESSKCELNLPFEQRKSLLDKNETLMHSSNAEIQTTTLEDLMKCLSQLKDFLLVQLKEERFQEFKNSEYWKQFQTKLNEPKLDTTHDFSFLWVTSVRHWTPKQVSLWLKSMDIEEHALFEEHEVDGKILASVCRDDLVRMGITKIGSLKKVLRLFQEISQKK